MKTEQELKLLGLNDLVYSNTFFEIFQLLGEPLIDLELIKDDPQQIYLIVKKYSSFKNGKTRALRLLDYFKDIDEPAPKLYHDLYDYFDRVYTMQENKDYDMDSIHKDLKEFYATNKTDYWFKLNKILFEFITRVGYSPRLRYIMTGQVPDYMKTVVEQMCLLRDEEGRESPYLFTTLNGKMMNETLFEKFVERCFQDVPLSVIENYYQARSC